MITSDSWDKSKLSNPSRLIPEPQFFITNDRPQLHNICSARWTVWLIGLQTANFMIDVKTSVTGYQNKDQGCWNWHIAKNDIIRTLMLTIINLVSSVL